VKVDVKRRQGKKEKGVFFFFFFWLQGLRKGGRWMGKDIRAGLEIHSLHFFRIMGWVRVFLYVYIYIYGGN
jgi:hypothetical protein